jgi:murein L,D-transpeptidase YafK
MRRRLAAQARLQAARCLPLLLLLGAIVSEPSAARAFDTRPWILVDGSAAEVRVMRGAETIETFSNISVGRGGVGYKARLGDKVTPTGTFRIAWINRDSPYYRFFGFDYPTLLYAERARLRQSLTQEEYRQIVTAHDSGDIPPQTTALGGRLGIHGIGKGDPAIHAQFNWTAGCVALTNEQIDRLTRWARVGTLVVITR